MCLKLPGEALHGVYVLEGHYLCKPEPGRRRVRPVIAQLLSELHRTQ
jgi:hypothetical protein